MNQEDKELRSLFADFQPEMLPETDFMSRLDARLDAVEFIQQRNADMKRACRRAARVAAAVGVAVGFVMGLIVPYVAISIPESKLLCSIAGGMGADTLAAMVKWLVAGLATVSISMCAYHADLSRAKVSEKI